MASLPHGTFLRSHGLLNKEKLLDRVFRSFSKKSTWNVLRNSLALKSQNNLRSFFMFRGTCNSQLFLFLSIQPCATHFSCPSLGHLASKINTTLTLKPKQKLSFVRWQFYRFLGRILAIFGDGESDFGAVFLAFYNLIRVLLDFRLENPILCPDFSLLPSAREI